MSKLTPSPFVTPPGQYAQYVDPRTDQRFSKQLKEAKQRQALRDLEHDVYLDNNFFGVPYKSIFDEYPEMAEAMGVTIKDDGKIVKK